MDDCTFKRSIADSFARIARAVDKLAQQEKPPVWHFQLHNRPSVFDEKGSLCDVPGGDCTRQIENVTCEACLLVLNQLVQEKFK